MAEPLSAEIADAAVILIVGVVLACFAVKMHVNKVSIAGRIARSVAILIGLLLSAPLSWKLLIFLLSYSPLPTNALQVDSNGPFFLACAISIPSGAAMMAWAILARERT